MRGFCFTALQSELSVLQPNDGDDQALFLIEWAKRHEVQFVAMDADTCTNTFRHGVNDLIRAGIVPVVVDPSYSPINDKQVRPIMVARSFQMLEKEYPDCIVIGSLLKEAHARRKLQDIKAHFQDGVPAYYMDVFKSGWSVASSGGTGDQLKTRLYQYRVERDYELEIKKNDRRKQR